jgi:hypothetical protein
MTAWERTTSLFAPPAESASRVPPYVGFTSHAFVIATGVVVRVESPRQSTADPA